MSHAQVEIVHARRGSAKWWVMHGRHRIGSIERRGNNHSGVRFVVEIDGKPTRPTWQGFSNLDDAKAEALTKAKPGER